MTFELHPRQGLGLARFGMNPEEVDQVFGGLEGKRADYDDPERKSRYYSNWINAGFEGDQLNLIGATRRATGITYKGVDIFKTDPFEVLRMLEHDCGKVHDAGVGFIVFVSFGISLTGFHNNDPDDMAMAIEPPHVWESQITSLKPISFL